MADPILMLSDELVDGVIDSFVDKDGKPQSVDSVEWRTSDPTVFTVVASPDGMNVSAVSVDMPTDTPAKTAQLSLHVKEAGVDDAIVLSFDVIVSSLSSPPAIGANVSFGPAKKKTP